MSPTAASNPAGAGVTDPQTGADLGGPILVAAAPPERPVDTLLAMAEQLETGVPAEALTLARAADSVMQLIRDPRYTRKVHDALAAVLGEADRAIRSGGVTVGDRSTLVLGQRIWVGALEQVVEIDEGYHKQRVAVEGDALLSDLGRQRAIEELQEQTLKRIDDVLAEADSRFSAFLDRRRTDLDKLIPGRLPSESERDASALEQIDKSLDLANFMAVYRDIPDDELRAMVSDLVSKNSPFAPAALRFLALRGAQGMVGLGSYVAALGAEPRGVELARMVQDPPRLQGAVEEHCLRRLESRVRAEMGAARRAGGAPEVLVDGWKGQPISWLSP